MKKTLLLSILFVLSAATSFAQVFDFTLSNETGYDIESVYVAPSDADEWGEDVLGDEILEDGDSVEIQFDKEIEALLLAFNVDKYDLRIEYLDGSEDEYFDLTLEAITELTLTLDEEGAGVALWK